MGSNLWRSGHLQRYDRRKEDSKRTSYVDARDKHD